MSDFGTCFKCNSPNLIDISTWSGEKRFLCQGCGSQMIFVPRKETPMSDQAKFEPKELPMRSRRDAELLLEYLMAKDSQHPDISLLRWMLQDHKAGVDSQILEMEKAFAEERAEFESCVRRLDHKISIQDTELRRLKSEPDHK